MLRQKEGASPMPIEEINLNGIEMQGKIEVMFYSVFAGGAGM